MFGFKNAHKLTDSELIEKYRKTSDKSIVGILFERHTDFVFYVCMKYLHNSDDASEAVMLIFEKLFTDLKEHKVEKFKPWLHVVSRNHCLLTLRSEKYKQKFQEQYKNELHLFMENGEEMYHDNEQDKEIKLEKLEVAINQLNEEQKQCIKLFYLEDKSYNEVAELTGFDLKKVKSFIQNGKRNLKILMEKQI
ncbi:MAG: sigma-70 family RNA polymerase sigma factor [Bacteroidales bacterium]|nr:sigma-70 family RNA polymerase sigma factor [Bacteroidales bacterium]